MPAFGTFGAHQGSASLLLERSNPELRRLTPDSEALASSDDEPDHGRSAAANSARPGKPGRRTSWLNDTSAANVNRKPSITGPYSPATSHPGTPGVENPLWTNANAAGPAAWSNQTGSSYPWNTIWNPEGRNNPPARLQEMPVNVDTGIPFTIPLEPSFKPVRSMSYSVGQLDTSVAPPANPISTSAEATRNRLGGQYPGVRRPSRPGALGGMEHGGLGKVREADDDEEEDQRVNLMRNTVAHNHPQKIQRFALWKRPLLQRRANICDRIMPSVTPTSLTQPPGLRISHIPPAVHEQYEAAVDDREDVTAFGASAGRNNNPRRMSEQVLTAADRQSFSPTDNRNVDSMGKKGYWQSSLGFGPIPEAPQSRRHSFADVPTRHGSFSSTGKQLRCCVRHPNMS